MKIKIENMCFDISSTDDVHGSRIGLGMSVSHMLRQIDRQLRSVSQRQDGSYASFVVNIRFNSDTRLEFQVVCWDFIHRRAKLCLTYNLKYIRYAVFICLSSEELSLLVHKPHG